MKSDSGLISIESAIVKNNATIRRSGPARLYRPPDASRSPSQPLFGKFVLNDQYIEIINRGISNRGLDAVPLYRDPPSISE